MLDDMFFNSVSAALDDKRITHKDFRVYMYLKLLPFMEDKLNCSLGFRSFNESKAKLIKLGFVSRYGFSGYSFPIKKGTSLSDSEPSERLRTKRNSSAAASEFPKSNDPKINYHGIIEKYNDICNRLKGCKLLNEKRRGNLRKINQELTQAGVTWEEFFEKVSKSKFLRGENDRSWIADFDFVTNPNKFAALLEGKYEGPKSYEEQLQDFFNAAIEKSDKEKNSAK